MHDDAATQMREMVDDHMARFFPKEAGLIGLIIGVSTLGRGIGELQAGTGNWALALKLLRAGIRDTSAAVKFTQDDDSLARLRGFAERQLKFASYVEPDVAKLAGE